MKINKNYLQLEESYLFQAIAKKVSTYERNHPEAQIIKLGIGDVTKPLCKSVVEAMEVAVREMGSEEKFRGYGPEQGYPFLREAIEKYYLKKGVELQNNEIFISDGAKSDLANSLDIFSKENKVLIPSPVYPVYVDTNIMDGREIVYLEGTKENQFLPLPDESLEVDLIYICSPNNPTGAVYTREQLKVWVDYALKQDAIILFDAAYEAFVQNENLPTSIYEIEGATKCAIEFCSYSKTAGFTGVRCGYTIVPLALKREEVSLNSLWLRRQTTKFNGVSYIVQKGAEAIYTEAGKEEIKKNIQYYLENAKLIREALNERGIQFVGGEDSPYIWMECPNGKTSWEYFDELLEKAQVVGTPGIGFGKNGEHFFRLTAFNSRAKVLEAIKRIIAIQ